MDQQQESRKAQDLTPRSTQNMPHAGIKLFSNKKKLIEKLKKKKLLRLKF